MTRRFRLTLVLLSCATLGFLVAGAQAMFLGDLSDNAHCEGTQCTCRDPAPAGTDQDCGDLLVKCAQYAGKNQFIVNCVKRRKPFSEMVCSCTVPRIPGAPILD
jgi:hypothetical protein